MREMSVVMDRNKALMELMCIQLREQERLVMYQVLKIRHDDNLLPFEVKRTLAAHYQRGDRLVTFLKEFGYARRGRTFKFIGSDQLGLPNIVLGDSVSIDDLPTEVVNSMWLKIVLKRKQAAQRARATRMVKDAERKRRQTEEAAEMEKEEVVPTAETDEEDEYSYGGF